MSLHLQTHRRRPAASDPDVPSQTLRFDLPVHPPGAILKTVRGTNGVILWTPKREAAKSTNLFTVVVTDNGVPSLSTTQTFNVIVTEFAQSGFGTLVMQAGQDGCIPIKLDSSEPITNVNFTVIWPPGSFTNITIQPLVPEICASNLQFRSASEAVVNLSTCPGQPLTLTEPTDVAVLCFTAVAGQQSAFVPLVIAHRCCHPIIGLTRWTSSRSSNGRS